MRLQLLVFFKLTLAFLNLEQVEMSPECNNLHLGIIMSTH